MIETPCIKVCTLDSKSLLCTGCGRSLEEIARWGSMSDGERKAIMRELPKRMPAQIGGVTDALAGHRSPPKP